MVDNTGRGTGSLHVSRRSSTHVEGFMCFLSGVNLYISSPHSLVTHPHKRRRTWRRYSRHRICDVLPYNLTITPLTQPYRIPYLLFSSSSDRHFVCRTAITLSLNACSATPQTPSQHRHKSSRNSSYTLRSCAKNQSTSTSIMPNTDR